MYRRYRFRLSTFAFAFAVPTVLLAALILLSYAALLITAPIPTLAVTVLAQAIAGAVIWRHHKRTPARKPSAPAPAVPQPTPLQPAYMGKTLVGYMTPDGRFIPTSH